MGPFNTYQWQDTEHCLLLMGSHWTQCNFLKSESLPFCSKGGKKKGNETKQNTGSSLLLVCVYLILTFIKSLPLVGFSAKHSPSPSSGEPYLSSFYWSIDWWVFLFLLLTLLQMSSIFSLHPVLPSTQPPPHHLHHIVFCVHGLCIYVLWLISLPVSPPLPFEICRYGACLHAHASAPILFVSLFCSLDSTHEWDHMVFIFLWLAYFA